MTAFLNTRGSTINEGAFHEKVVNTILDDLVDCIKPRFMEVVMDFFVRGGIHTVVTARHGENKFFD